MIRNYLIPVLLILTCSIYAGCSEPDRSDVAPETDDTRDSGFSFSFSVVDADGEPVSPAGIYIFDAEEGLRRTPSATYDDSGTGVIEGNAEKGRPFIFRINAKGHLPLYLFIPSTFEDAISAEVRPAAIQPMETITPKVIGNFNHYDRFSAVEMELQNDGSWMASLESETDTLRYLIAGVVPVLAVHGTRGNQEASHFHTHQEQGIESVIIREDSGPVNITFNPSEFANRDTGYSVSFSEYTPARTAAVAKAYAAMTEQERKLEMIRKAGTDPDGSHFEPFISRLQTIAEMYDHDNAEIAARIAKARFIDLLNPGEDWADSLLNDVQPGSDLWLMHESVIGDLFYNSTRMESVSQNLWDIYRQNRSETIQGEALYNLLSFHYERGEDEEWYQAHFDLVRNYPGHPRINDSYSRGYAPESVVFVGRYFPDLSFRSADRTTEYTPAEYDANLSILFFWSPDDEQSLDQITRLKSLYNRFAGRGLTVTAIALYPDAKRIERFHSHHNLPWKTAAETLRSPAVQVIGITSVPHTIVLDSSNRVLVNNDAFLNDDRIEEMVEEYFLRR